MEQYSTAMGRVWSKLTRPVKNINVESRAHKVIDEIPTRAPNYPSTEKVLDKFINEHPELLDKQKQKDEGLLTNLKHIRIESFGPPPEIKSLKRPLPTITTTQKEPEYGFFEPRRIPVGKTSIRLALNFLADHQAAPKTYSAAVIATEHKLDIRQVEQVIKYFHTFHIHMPLELKKKHPKLLDLLETKKTIGAKDHPELLDTPVEPEVKKT
ncbi:NADH dehydrogenase [ubiquinone] 1 alpha subcomplex assembly factor 4-like [Gigantopelta aegis]|uniref:NADH dehydrogenase [ubiquinone] 1 alpha subcomplex assembly factor 4-like n=1 Tax=Gigantopelta aegis TaxID=1735272 RepID=UPI001B887E0C|nr:NADH dehydrogenase [ubiquinone] 1 alpha subcomplex assembly factor 4-like [Gigantopelta aegis]